MSLRNILDEFGTKLKEDLRKSLIDKGVEYDGGDSRLSASVKFYYSERNGNPVFNLAMNDYWEVLNDGRGADEKRPPIEPLENWIKRKGLKPTVSIKKQKITKALKNKITKKAFKQQIREKAIKAMAYAMSVSIGKKGFKGNHFADEVIKDGRLEVLQKQISEYMKTEIIVTFNKKE